MECLRTHRNGKVVEVQTPVVALTHRASGRTAHLVLTAHLADRGYFERLREDIARFPGTVFYEGVRATSNDPKHWRGGSHRFLRRLRTEVYQDLAALGSFSFQGEALAPEDHWVNADVDCCQFAARIDRAGISLLKYELGMNALARMTKAARNGDERAVRQLEWLIKFGMAFLGIGPTFRLMRLLPGNDRVLSVLADWRNDVALDRVGREGGDFVLIYGAAHGPGLLKLLGDRGWTEQSREWHSVFRL